MTSKKLDHDEMISLFTSNEDWLADRIADYACRQDELTSHSGHSNETWRKSVQDLNASISLALQAHGTGPTTADRLHTKDDLLLQFGALQGKRHYQHKIPLYLSLRLLKYCRDSYLHLIREKAPREVRHHWERTLIHCFDRIEISFCTQLAETSVREKEEQLLQTQSKYKDIFNATRDAIFIHDPRNGQILEVNKRAEELYQATLEDFQTLDPDIFCLGQSPYSKQEIMAWIKKSALHAPQQFEWLARKKNGELFWTEVCINNTSMAGQPRMIATVHEISRRKAMEQALTFSRDMFKKVLDTIPVRVFWKDQNSVYLGCNKKFAQDAGLRHPKELVGRTDFDLPWSSREARLYREDDQEVINSGQPKIGFIEPQTTDSGTQIWLRTSKVPLKDSHGKIIGVLGCYEDITKQKEAEKQKLELEKKVLQVQKLESLGVLAGGIAHDFNNILTGILNNTELALMQLKSDLHLKKFLQAISISAQRAADVCRQMLAYSGRGQFSLERIDLNRLCEELIKIITHSISKNIEIQCDLADMPTLVRGDPGQLGQVIMNLLINGAEAIGDQNGILRVSTGEMYQDRQQLKVLSLGHTMTPGRYCLLEVTDTGCGMDEKTLSKMFDPFFSTKFTGRGLGLAAVQGIVRGHKGGIKVYSEPGQGTSVKVFLPAISEKHDTPDKPSPASEQEKGFTGLVLLVDDEKTIRDIGRDILQFLGFSVLTAADGQRAIEIFKEHKKEIDLVVMDLTMPKLDGLKAAKQIRKIRPEVKIIISSGFNAKEVKERCTREHFDHFLQKPYQISQLKETIHKVLAD